MRNGPERLFEKLEKLCRAHIQCRRAHTPICSDRWFTTIAILLISGQTLHVRRPPIKGCPLQSEASDDRDSFMDRY